MDDLISRQAAIDALQHIDISIIPYKKAREYADATISEIRNRLKKLPSIQPDIIVCAYCKHWVCHDRRCGYWNHGTEPLEWCCHAERRTDETD